MSVTDPVADMMSKIHNAGAAGHESVDILPSKFKIEIIKTLKTEGFVRNFKRVGQDGQGPVRVFLKYDNDSKPVIRGMQRISKPGRRVYKTYRTLPRVLGGYGTLIVSTSSGVITGRRALQQQVGGELICSVW